MNNPRKFVKPCTMTALAVAMATPLSIIVRSSIANTIIACVGGKDEQSKVSCGYFSSWNSLKTCDKHHENVPIFQQLLNYNACGSSNGLWIFNYAFSLLQLAGPISIGETYDSTLIKFNRKELSDLLAVDQEKPMSNRLPSGLRHRGTAIAPTAVAWEEQPLTHNTRSDSIPTISCYL